MAVTLNGQRGASVLRCVAVGYRNDLESVHALLPLLVVWTVAMLDLRSSHVNVIMPHAQVRVYNWTCVKRSLVVILQVAGRSS
jgi:hypothetical protein